MSRHGTAKKLNEYVRSLGDDYANTPKAVYAAIALSLAYIDVEEASMDAARRRLAAEWDALHENGIVPQKRKEGR